MQIKQNCLNFSQANHSLAMCKLLFLFFMEKLLSAMQRAVFLVTLTYNLENHLNEY
jgi:hypothetical protein